MTSIRNEVSVVLDELLAERTCECRNAYCQERCGITTNDHRSHHELAAELKLNRDRIFEAVKAIERIEQTKRGVSKVVGETVIQMLTMAVLSGVFAGLMAYALLTLKGGLSKDESVRSGIVSGAKGSTP